MYMGAWETIRALFAGTPEAKAEGLTAVVFFLQFRHRPLPAVPGRGLREGRDAIPLRPAS